MNVRYIGGLWLATVLAAWAAGANGGWMVSWLSGNATTVEIECYQYYGRQETVHHRCEGGWQRTQPDSGVGPTRYVAGGPMVGVPIKPGAGLADPNQSSDFGYRLEARLHPDAVFAVLTADGAVVVPVSARIVGPLGVLALIACGVSVIVLRRRDVASRRSISQGDLTRPIRSCPFGIRDHTFCQCHW